MRDRENETIKSASMF